MTKVLYARLDSRFTEIKCNLKRIKLHRVNQGSSWFKGSISNRNNAIAPTQFKRERQRQYLKGLFSIKNRPIHLHINSNTIIGTVKRNKLEFSRIEISCSSCSWPVNITSNFVKSKCQKIYSWKRRPEIILQIRKKNTYFKVISKPII